MKKWQFWVSVFLGLGSIGAVACLILLGSANLFLERKLDGAQAELDTAQMELQKQQEVIAKGSFSQQVGNNLLRDMDAMSSKNKNIRNILVMHGYAKEGAAPARGGAK